MTSTTFKLSQLLTKSENWISISPEERYKQVTARLWGKGLILRAEVTGSEIAAARQLRARAGQFLVSRIDARHGAYGIVPEELDGAAVSNDFPCFDINEAVVAPRYFEWLSSTPGFIDLCRRASEGSTNRVRLKEDSFLALSIPLPPLEDQHRIVARLDRAAALVRARREAVAAAEADLQSLLTKAFHRIAADAPRLPMREVAPLVRRPLAIDLDARYPELGVRSFGRGTFHKPELSGSDAGSKKLFRIEPGDLVFNIVFAWEGAVAIAQPTDAGRVGSHRFLTCVPKADLVAGAFLDFFFQTADGIGKLGAASPGGAGRNRTLGVQKLEGIAVPIPDRGAQEWFLRLLHRAEELRAIRTASTADIDALLPALLNETFAERSDAG